MYVWISMFGVKQIAITEGINILIAGDQITDFEHMGALRKNYQSDLIWFQFITFESNEQWRSKNKQTEKMKDNFIEISPG